MATSFRGRQSYSEIRVVASPPARVFSLGAGIYLASRFDPRSLGAGPCRVFVSLDCLPIAEGVLPSLPLPFRDEIADQGMLRCGGLPMLSEFQLWVLSTIVMVADVIVGVKLSG